MSDRPSRTASKSRRKNAGGGGRTAARGGGNWGRRLAWLALILVAALIFAPIIGVAAVRWVNPPVTSLMLLRWVEGKFSKHYDGSIHYQWIDLRRVPPDFLRCVLVAEDARFFEHGGFDWKEIAAAEAQAKRRNKPPRGASTITNQCARSLFLWPDRSWIRKGLEAYYTVLMEWLLPKRRILELYVNAVEMGDGIYGIEAAARHSYGVPASRLTFNQCAMLAAVLPNPRERDPRHPSAGLQQHYDKILGRVSHARLPKFPGH